MYGVHKTPRQQTVPSNRWIDRYFNHPEGCEVYPTPCAPKELFTNAHYLHANRVDAPQGAKAKPERQKAAPAGLPNARPNARTQV